MFHLENHQNPKSAKSIVETQDSQTQKLLIVLSWKAENPFTVDTMLVVDTNFIRIAETKTTTMYATDTWSTKCLFITIYIFFCLETNKNREKFK